MPPIKTIRVQNVRAHKEYQLDLSPNVTVITGPNGSGKTSIIEAIYIALRGSSFKGSDNDVLRRDLNWYRIDVTNDDEEVRTVKFESERQTGRKQFEVNGKTHYRLPHQHRYPVVLFEPDDLRLLNGSPTRRRQFIDTLIGQIDPEYVIAIRRYDRALKQRNTLLKTQTDADALFAWNISLSKYGAYIISKRLAFIDRIQQELGDTYRHISHTEDKLGITYSHPAYKGSIEQKLLSELETYMEKDKILGFTSTGPHRHDVLFAFNDSPALQGASRGEIRTIILALKFIEVAIIESALDKRPIILLDDVFSELDKTRQAALIDKFTNHQTIIASVNAVTKKGKIIELAG
ncbi:MAG TPA: DNA replication and repair protein RecF [Candidatus Saccharimonadales bacterium]|nr:DNA replication and repair protein RecF [Candidatus Saccharimonadales bacterium]